MRYKFRCYPAPPQARELARVFGSARHAYNWALRLRTDSYKGGKTVNYVGCSSEWTRHRNASEFSWLKRTSSVPQQQALRHLQTSFKNFFERRTGYPAFKRKHGKQSAEYTKSAFSWDPVNRNLRLSGVGRLDVHWSRRFASSPSTITITKDRAGRYFVTLCLDEQVTPMPKTGESVGIDLGVSRLATLSTGERVANPQHLGRNLAKLGRMQRQLSRRHRGSGRWSRKRLAVARLHAHVADSRKDYLDKFTTSLVRRFDVLAIEDLNVRGMMANHCLARAIGDAGLSTFRRMVTYKCLRYGKELKTVDRFFPSSKRCHRCGHVVETLPLSTREWDCPECGAHHDRDENAAINILAAGHAVPARGGTVRRVKASALKRKFRRTVNQPAL